MDDDSKCECGHANRYHDYAGCIQCDCKNSDWYYQNN